MVLLFGTAFGIGFAIVVVIAKEQRIFYDLDYFPLQRLLFDSLNLPPVTPALVSGDIYGAAWGNWWVGMARQKPLLSLMQRLTYLAFD